MYDFKNTFPNESFEILQVEYSLTACH